jgi:hypothetical protein
VHQELGKIDDEIMEYWEGRNDAHEEWEWLDVSVSGDRPQIRLPAG